MAPAALRVIEGASMDKTKALDAALSQIERNFGKGTVMKFGEGAIAQVESISTGSLGLDIALGLPILIAVLAYVTLTFRRT